MRTMKTQAKMKTLLKNEELSTGSIALKHLKREASTSKIAVWKNGAEIQFSLKIESCVVVVVVSGILFYDRQNRALDFPNNVATDSLFIDGANLDADELEELGNWLLTECQPLIEKLEPFEQILGEVYIDENN